MSKSLLLDQECIVRVPLTRVATEEKPFISENFAPYRIFKNLFLPQGYPDSVSSDYIHYQFWDTIQAFCSTINGNRFIVREIIIKIDFMWRFYLFRYLINARDFKRRWRRKRYC